MVTRKPVSKRLRFEILRRDNNACRYCGATAPDATLVVDHILPVALGGQTVAENLVTACRDCNSGKTSTSPNEHTVAQVNEKAIHWSQAIAQAAAEREAGAHDSARFLEYVSGEWDERHNASYPRPIDWEISLNGFRNRGLPISDFDRAIDIAQARPNIPAGTRWTYFCGILHNFARELEEAAQKIVHMSQDVSLSDSRQCGHCLACRQGASDDCFSRAFGECEFCGVEGCDYQIGYDTAQIDAHFEARAVADQ